MNKYEFIIKNHFFESAVTAETSKDAIKQPIIIMNL